MNEDDSPGTSRRDLIVNDSAGIAAAIADGRGIDRSRRRQTRARGPINSGHNNPFVFTDQERHFFRWPRSLDLPGHERLTRTGTYLGQNPIGAAMFTSSRSIMMPGLHTAANGMKVP